MTNDGKNGTTIRGVERPREACGTQASRATDDRSEGVTNNRPTNWAWALGVLGYDWMDSHYFPTDFHEALGQIEK